MAQRLSSSQQSLSSAQIGQQVANIVETPVLPPANFGGTRSGSGKGFFSRMRTILTTPGRGNRSGAGLDGSAGRGPGVFGARPNSPAGQVDPDAGARGFTRRSQQGGLGVFGAQTGGSVAMDDLGVFGAQIINSGSGETNSIGADSLGVFGARTGPSVEAASARRRSPGGVSAPALPVSSLSKWATGENPLEVRPKVSAPFSALKTRPVPTVVTTAASGHFPSVSKAAVPVASSAPAGVTSVYLPLTSVHGPATTYVTTSLSRAGSSTGRGHPPPSRTAYTTPVLSTSKVYASASHFGSSLNPAAASFVAGVYGARPEDGAAEVSPSASWSLGVCGARQPELDSPDGWIDDLDQHRNRASLGARSLVRLPKRELMKGS